MIPLCWQSILRRLSSFVTLFSHLKGLHSWICTRCSFATPSMARIMVLASDRPIKFPADERMSGHTVSTCHCLIGECVFPARVGMIQSVDHPSTAQLQLLLLPSQWGLTTEKTAQRLFITLAIEQYLHEYSHEILHISSQ